MSFSRVFPWGSYLVLCIVNRWIRNSDKCCFPSQCERKRACCQEEEVTNQLQIRCSWETVPQLIFPASRSPPHLEPLHHINQGTWKGWPRATELESSASSNTSVREHHDDMRSLCTRHCCKHPCFKDFSHSSSEACFSVQTRQLR